METNKPESVQISRALYDRLVYLGIIDSESTRKDNVGESDYSKHLIQPWSIWVDYNLNPFDADIIKRILRRKGNSELDVQLNRVTDYQKIIHICEERLRQIMNNPSTTV